MKIIRTSPNSLSVNGNHIWADDHGFNHADVHPSQIESVQQFIDREN